MNLTPHQSTTPSFAKSAIPLSLTLRPSRLYLTGILALHILAFVAVSLAAIPVALKIIIAILVAASLGYNGSIALKHTQLIWRAGNVWLIETQDNQHTAHLNSINFLSRWLVIISLQVENQRLQKFIIPFDAVNTDSFRLLRVRLRIEGHAILNPEDEP